MLFDFFLRSGNPESDTALQLSLNSTYNFLYDLVNSMFIFVYPLLLHKTKTPASALLFSKTSSIQQGLKILDCIYYTVA